MIGAEAPILFAKAAEMFILELTLRAWIHTEENKRRTLQRQDIAAAIMRTDTFDFLIDIVPREEVRQNKKIPENPAMMSPEYQQYIMQNYVLQQQQVHLLNLTLERKMEFIFFCDVYTFRLSCRLPIRAQMLVLLEAEHILHLLQPLPNTTRSIPNTTAFIK